MKYKYILAFCTMFLTSVIHVNAQQYDSYKDALDSIYVERYYIANDHDATDVSNGVLSKGTTTYRIFVDMKPGFRLSTVFGITDHELRIETTGKFFNNTSRGTIFANNIADKSLKNNTVILDSWLSMGAGSTGNLAVTKEEDTNGSIGNIDGFVQNDDSLAGIPVKTKDGLIPGKPASIVSMGIDTELGVFDDGSADGSALVTSNGFWVVLDGVQGPTATNRVLIAQLTTNGTIMIKLNLQINISDSIRCARCLDSKGCTSSLVDPICKYSAIAYVHQSMPDDLTRFSETFVYERKDLSFTIGVPPLCDTCSIANETIKVNTEFEIFPNPAKDAISLKISNPKSGSECSYSITNVLGSRIYNKKIGMLNNSHIETLDISSYPEGIYFVELRVDQQTITKKIVKY